MPYALVTYNEQFVWCCSIAYIGKEFAWYASLNFDKFTPYFHVQSAHAGQMVLSRPPEITLGCLKNEVLERKQQEANNLHTTQGAGRGGPTSAVRGVRSLTLSWDIVCVFQHWNSLIFGNAYIKVWQFFHHWQTADWNKMDLDKEMRAQYIHLRMSFDDMLPVSLKIWHIRYSLMLYYVVSWSLFFKWFLNSTEIPLQALDLKQGSEQIEGHIF